MSLICIFDRGYDIKHNQDLITELAKLQFCRHIRLVFIDSEPEAALAPGSPAPQRIEINTPGHQMVYPELLNDPQDVASIKEYIRTQYNDKPNEIRLYIAPNLDGVNRLIKNMVDPSATLDTQNTLGMICLADKLVVLIKMLQTMDFSKKTVHKIYIPSDTNTKLKNNVHLYDLVNHVDSKKMFAYLKNIFAKNFKRNIHPYYNSEERIDKEISGSDYGPDDHQLDIYFEFGQYIWKLFDGESLFILLPSNLENVNLTISNFLEIEADKNPDFTNLDPTNMPPKLPIISKAANTITEKYIAGIKSASTDDIKKTKELIQKITKFIKFYEDQLSKLKKLYSDNDKLREIKKQFIDPYISIEETGTITVDTPALRAKLMEKYKIKIGNPDERGKQKTKFIGLIRLIKDILAKTSLDKYTKSFTNSDKNLEDINAENTRDFTKFVNLDDFIVDMMDANEFLETLLFILRYITKYEYYYSNIYIRQSHLQNLKFKLNELENIKYSRQKTMKASKLGQLDKDQIKYTTLKQLRNAAGNNKFIEATTEIEKLRPELEKLRQSGTICEPHKFGHKARLFRSKYKRACELENRLASLIKLKENMEQEQERIEQERRENEVLLDSTGSSENSINTA